MMVANSSQDAIIIIKIKVHGFGGTIMEMKYDLLLDLKGHA